MTILWIGLASGVATTVMAWSELFRPLRAPLTGRLAYLAGCPVCLAGWLTLALTWLQGVPEGVVPLVAWWASWGISALVSAALIPLTGPAEGDGR